MSKYTDDALKGMAKIVMKDTGDRPFQLILTIAMRTGMKASDVKRRIERLANA
jgi:hypothetical protein